MSDFHSLTAAELSDLKAKAKAATPGPYFVAEDIADDATAHRKSGLALVDTGRMNDWPVARLCEWKQAQFTAAANPETILRLIDMVERRDAWQLIETAPKDGTAILFYDPNTERGGSVFEGMWHEDGWMDFCDNFPRTPTHWMPLPEPPIELSAATEPKP